MYIRLARKDDGRGIAALHVASWRATYRDELPAGFLESLDLDARTAEWEAEIAGDAHVLVADTGTELAGFVAGGATRDDVADGAETFEIYNLHVAPERHGQGVGRTLFAEALELARGAGARTLSLWVVEGNANARRFYERQGMEADGARQVHPLAAGAELREIRYRMEVRAVEVEAGERQGLSGLLEAEPESLAGRLALLAALTISTAVLVYWVYPRMGERAAGIAAQREFDTAPVAEARRAAQREVHLLLRPVDHEGNIGMDRAARSWRLGLAYGRLALVEERAGDTAKRDEYLDRARRALREAGVRDPTDAYIRERLRSASPPPR